MGNSAKLFIRENLADCNKLAFKCSKIKIDSLICSTFTGNGIVHIMKTIAVSTKKFTHMSKLVGLFSDFDFHYEE